MAIRNYKFNGLCFGSNELYAIQPFNGDNKCLSCVNRVGYSIGVNKDANNKLTLLPLDEDGDCSWFTTVELEVWSVMFE